MPKMSRRTFLWMTGGSSIALATDSPRKLINKLIPQVIPPENIQPGDWITIATTCRECPAGCGMHLSHRDGRVTKAEGNPQHLVNRGTLCARGQSSLQGLYDPDRVQKVLQRQKDVETPITRTWEEGLTAIAGKLAAGARVAFISRLETGALAEVMKGFCSAYGSDRMLFYEPFSYEHLRTAHQELFGLPRIPFYNLENADFILSFAADFLETWISPVSYAMQWGNRRSYPLAGNARNTRMVYVGPRLSMTAGNADQFIQVPPGHERNIAAAILKIIIERGWAKNDLRPLLPAIKQMIAQHGPIQGISGQRLVQLARTFISARTSVALAGPQGTASRPAVETAALVALLNHAAGRIGTTVDFSRPHALSNTSSEADLQRFMALLGPKDILFVHEANPVYANSQAAQLMKHTGMTVYLGTMMDETAQTADWFLPVDYSLEAWGDYDPDSATHGIIQPTLARLYDTRLTGDILIDLSRRAGKRLVRTPSAKPPADFLGWLKQRWERLRLGQAPQALPDLFWIDALRNGGVWSSNKPKVAPVALKPTAMPFLTAPVVPKPRLDADMAELWLWPSIMLYDGRLANRGWLQETPDPVTFIVWGNWIDLHPAKAARLGIRAGDQVELSSSSGTVTAPVRISNDVNEQTAALSFGQGHSALGSKALGVGVNAFWLLGAAGTSSMFATCRIRKAAKQGRGLIYTAPDRDQHEREILQWTPLSQVSLMRAGEGQDVILPLPEGYRPDRDMYPPREYLSHRWAMVVDLQRCIGCGACTVACYAENNIAVIGKDKVGAGREMAWLRVAPYEKPGQTGRLGWLPLLCQHCDAAPCEPVCPVFAAVHNEEGLNAQIYNRCIGTRYCSNNCPYKVRRFNWINLAWKKPLDLQLNPEVTVRSRGVMEKCTFCVQRIRQAEYRAARENRKVLDGEIQTACMQTCPARVFAFGDLLDPDSLVSRLTRKDPRRYHLLEELNTKTAVTYLRRIDMEA
ncbi:MAG TPA: molybdopterin dinucleotide binding domain-containing protein [Desulfuromonadaceae bacterium]|jgi:molybdopterin-containing oxidoreductase family iron-sulfur binding subunit